MRTIKTGVCAVLAALVVPAGGCGILSILDAFSAQQKISNDQMSQLTPSEIRALQGALLAATGGSSQVPPLSDSQSAAMADFLRQNNIDSVAQLQQAIRDAQTNPGAVQGVDELIGAFGMAPGTSASTAISTAFEENLFGIAGTL